MPYLRQVPAESLTLNGQFSRAQTTQSTRNLWEYWSIETHEIIPHIMVTVYGECTIHDDPHT